MKTLNLQLFAKPSYNKNVEKEKTEYTGASIVDYMKSTGQDSSFNNRSKIANAYGISNYTGTAEQNTKMLDMMKNASARAKEPKVEKGVVNYTQDITKGIPKNAVAGAPVVTPKFDNVEEPIASAVAPPSLKAEDLVLKGDNKAEAENAVLKGDVNPELTYYNNGKEPYYDVGTEPTYTAPTTKAEEAKPFTDRLDEGILNTLTSTHQQSEVYKAAWDFTNSLRSKVNTGKTTYTDQISQLIKDYQNREAFSYDPSDDALFQQMLSSSMASGKTAMADAMGQAASLTGGYGSTYSQAVGNNVYNQYISEAYDNLPQYYQMAFDRHNQEGQDMLTELSMLSDADAREYDRLYNAYMVNSDYTQNLYNQEYGAYRDKVNDAYRYAGLESDEYWSGLNYNEGIRQDERDFGYKQYQDEYNNWWNKEEANREQEWLDSEAEREQSNWEKEFNREDERWLAMNDLNGDGKVDVKDYEYEIASGMGDDDQSSTGSETVSYDSLTTTEINALKSAYKEAGGGEAGLTAASQMVKAMGLNVDGANLQAILEGTDDDYTPPTADIYKGAADAYAEGGEAGLEAFCDMYPGYNFNDIVDYAMKHSEVTNPSKKTYTKTGRNTFVDQYGNEYNLKDLPEEIRGQLKTMEEGKTYNFSTKRYEEEDKEKKALTANSLMDVTNGYLGLGRTKDALNDYMNKTL